MSPKSLKISSWNFADFLLLPYCSLVLVLHLSSKQVKISRRVVPNLERNHFLC